MATDIAFALGVLALFGKRVPGSLRVFLTALAIFDDIGAVLVIAFFYTDNLTPLALAASGALLGLTVALNWLGVRNMLVYSLLGIALWRAKLNSGFHATVAGILLALALPARARIDSAKTGILVGSVAAGVLGAILLSAARRMSKPRDALASDAPTLDPARKRAPTPASRRPFNPLDIGDQRLLMNTISTPIGAT